MSRPAFLTTLALMVLCASACVHPKQARSWRLMQNVLVPPEIAAAKVAETTVQTDAGGKGCPQGIRVKRKHAVVKITRKMLSNRPAGWVTVWADGLESGDCIAQGEALRFAQSIAESLPLEMNAAFQLLHPNDPNVVELNPNIQLQIMTPIVPDGTAPDAPLIETKGATVSANGNGINVTIDARFTNDMLGYEITWYSAKPKNHLSGISVAPVATDRHMNGNVEHPSLPVRDYFQPLSTASFYGLFYKGGQTEFTALIVGGTTKTDLDNRIRLLETGTASCETLNNDRCVTIPTLVAINPMVSVTINGTQKFLNWGATVGAAIRASGEQQANTVLPRLHIRKPYREGLTPLEFDPEDPAVLNLILMGGETIDIEK